MENNTHGKIFTVSEKIWVKSYKYSNHQKNTFMCLILQIRHASNNEWIIGNQNNIWLDNWESNNIWMDNWISFKRMNERFIRIPRKGMVKKCLAEWKDSDQTKVKRRSLISCRQGHSTGMILVHLHLVIKNRPRDEDYYKKDVECMI